MIERIDFMKSWKTTLFGAGGLLAVAVSIVNSLFDGDPNTMPQWDLLIAAAGPAIAALFARDNNVSSEHAGAK